MLCFYCHVQDKQGSLQDQTNKDDAYIKRGFSSWKKAPKCFGDHQNSLCHKAASLYHLVIPKCNDVGEVMSSQLAQQRQIERKYLLEVIKCLRYLGRQGIPLQGHDNNDNFTQLLYLLGSNDKNIMDHLNGKVGHKYNHHDVQNELLNIMANQVQMLYGPNRWLSGFTGGLLGVGSTNFMTFLAWGRSLKNVIS